MKIIFENGRTIDIVEDDEVYVGAYDGNTDNSSDDRVPVSSDSNGDSS